MAGAFNMVTISTEILTTQTAFYGVRQGVYVTLSTIHVSNAGAAGTFTVYVRPVGLSVVPISPINRAIDANGLAVWADPIVLNPGTIIEAIASAPGMSLLLTGLETVV